MINADLRSAPLRGSDGYALAHYAANSRAMANGTFRPLQDFTDGTANTLLVGEVNANFKPWGDPINCRDPSRNSTLSTPPHPVLRLLALPFTAKECGIVGLDGRRERIIEALQASPELSNRVIARRLGIDNHPVAIVRRELEMRGEIPRLTTLRDALGRPSPARKPKSHRA
jgi:hypothetical protein